MVSPLKISARVEIDASQASQGAKVAKDAVASIGGAAEVTTSQLQRLIATSVGLHDGPANQNQRQWTGALAAEGLAIDTLRAKYNPLFAVIQQYKAAQVEIRTAHAMGALSSGEMSAALSRERQETLASIDAIKGRNAALGAGAGQTRGMENFQTANLAFQLQDIGSTAAFMPWWTVALQQGPQVSAILGTMENKTAGLAAAFTSVLNPLSLVTIGVIGAAAYAIQYFTSAETEAEKASTAIEQHAEIIRSIKLAYGTAAEGLSDYVQRSNAELESSARVNLAALQGVAKETNAAFIDSVGSLRGRIGLVVDDQYAGFKQAILDLRRSMTDGEPDFVKFRRAVEEAVAADPANLAKLGDELINNSTAAADAQRRVASANDAIALLGGTASGQIADIKSLTAALNQLAGVAIPALTNADTISAATNQGLRALANSGTMNEEARRRLLLAQTQAQIRASNQNPFVVNSDGDSTSVPTPGNRPITLGDSPEKASAAAKSAANSYRDLIKSADDRIAQMKLEAEMSGETGVAADTLRFKLDLLQQGEEKGRSLSAKQVEAINQRVEAFKQYAEAAATAKLKSDLLFEREQLGRSSFDQEIASRLKGAGLEVDFDSYEAGLIRTNLQLEYARDLAGDFASTFIDARAQGLDFWDSLGEAGVSALKKISDTLLNDVLNSLFQVNNAGSSSGGIFSSILTSIFGGGGSFQANTTLGSFLSNGFSGGGPTGPGPVHQPKGIVHAGEVVFSQADVSRHGGVANVEAIRTGLAGYAGGGAVGVAPLGMQRSSTSAAAAASRGVDELRLKIGFDEEGNPFIRQREIAREEAVSTVRQGFAEYDGNLPRRVQQINANPRKV
jgi:hypothetical protein